MQHIFRVRAVTAVDTLPSDLADPSGGATGRHFIYQLGEEIPLPSDPESGQPLKIPSGPIRNSWLWLPLTALGVRKSLKEMSAEFAAARKLRRAKKAGPEG